MDRLRAGALLREGAPLAQQLSFGPLAGGERLDRVQQIVVALRRPTDMRQIGGEHQSQLGEDRPAQRQHTFLLAFAVDAEDAALGVEVADLDIGELVTTQAEHKQAEQAEPIPRVLRLR
jgi:hypothetical protein